MCVFHGVLRVFFHDFCVELTQWRGYDPWYQLGELTTFLGQLPYILDYIISAQLSSRCLLFELIFDILLEKINKKYRKESYYYF